jgi:hypothetical protein
MIFSKIQAFPTNWENGMKLSAADFQHLEDSVEDAMRDSRAIGIAANLGFGLLPYSPFALQNMQGNSPQSVRVVLNACRAVLPGGYRVEILPETAQQLQVPAKLPAIEFVPTAGVRYHLFLSVDERKRVPAGIPQVRPIRYPFLSPDYQLECLPHEKLSAAQRIAPNRMKIAEWQDGKIIEGYIPPVLTIKGFPILEQWHRFFQNQLENLARLSVKIVGEYRASDPGRASFCLPIVQYIRSSQAYFKWVLPSQSPVFLAAYYGDLAGLVEGLIETCDRDFVRNQLEEGQIHGLRRSIHDFLKPRMTPLEEMAIMLTLMQKFGEALKLTLEKLATVKGPGIRQGDDKK